MMMMMTNNVAATGVLFCSQFYYYYCFFPQGVALFSSQVITYYGNWLASNFFFIVFHMR